MTGSAGQNPDAAGKPAPVAVRIYQLTATAKFERGDVFALTEHEQATLGQDDAGSQEFVLSPSETQTKTFELKPGVQAVGVVVLYRDIDQAQWRADAPVASSGPTKLALNVGKLAITLKPAA
jgi:type VI secretion system protein VasD